MDGNNSKKLTILHVDDSEDYLVLTKHHLKEICEEIQIEWATNAKQAIDAVQKKEYHCIVSDYMMPGTDGIELLKTLRSMGDNTPFVILTNCENEDIEVLAFQNGADDFSIKKIGDRSYYGLLDIIQNSVNTRKDPPVTKQKKVKSLKEKESPLFRSKQKI